MKENALAATQSSSGGARKTLDQIEKLLADDPGVELHLVGFSAGAILLAPLIQMLATSGTIKAGPMKGKTGLGLTVSTCTLWAPACTVELFKETYLPAIRSPRVKKFALFTLTDRFERDDDCANIYHKSLLYLVSNAFEEEPRIPLFRDGVPILGMEKFIREDPELRKFFQRASAEWVLAPNTDELGSANASMAQHHGDFDDDRATLLATLARITGAVETSESMELHSSARAIKTRRRQLQVAVSDPRILTASRL
jgi:hypothetical protein